MAFGRGNSCGSVIDRELVWSVDLFRPLGDSALCLRASLRAISGEVSHLSALETHRVVGSGSRRALCVSTLGSPSSHWASSSWGSPRAVEIHGNWNIRVRWWGRGRVILGWFRVLSPVRILVSAVAVILLIRQILEPPSLIVALVPSW